MSIFKLRNETGSNTVGTPLGDGYSFSFVNSVPVDLLDEIGMGYDDLIGVQGGMSHDAISNLIRTGNWFLSDGDNDYLYDQALHVLKYGKHLSDERVKRSAKTVVSHDFAIKPTWSQSSIRKVAQVLTAVGTNSFKSIEDSGCWVNVENGFVYQEEKEYASSDKRVIIYIDGVVLDSKFYTIDYMAKTVTILQTYTLIGTEIITSDYNLSSNSYWEMVLKPNYITRIVKTEVQFNSNIQLDKNLIMEVVATHPNPAYPAIVLDSWKYKSIRDYMGGSNLGFSVPAFGGTGKSAGYLEDTIVLPFNYITPLELPTDKFIATLGLSNPRLRCYVEGHEPLNGLFTTVTFYLDQAKL